MKKLYALLIGFTFCFPCYQFAQTVTINANPGTSPNIVMGTLAYHASEFIYRNAEIGASSFTTTPISSVGFSVAQLGAPTTFTNISIYLQNTALDVFTTGTYSTAGYTLVYNGSITFDDLGFTVVDLQTPFLRTTGTNLEFLIVRGDGVAHPNYLFEASLDNTTVATSTATSRRYNGAAAPAAGSTSLATSPFRPSVQLIARFPIDAALTDATVPGITCHSTPQTIGIELTNNGSTAITAGSAAVTLNVTGANSFTSTISNSTVLAPGASETINFSGINLSVGGFSDVQAVVNLASDADQLNDSLFTGVLTATTLSNFPVLDDLEGPFTIAEYVDVIAGGRQLWSLHDPVNDTAFINVDMSDSLPAYSGRRFLYFDAYSGANSTGVEGRLFTNCIALGNAPGGGSCNSSLSFFMSHDTTFLTPNFDDSLYVSVSTDGGNSFTRIAGFRRLNDEFGVPGWGQEFVDLSAYNGTSIQIGFEGVSQWGNIIGIDNIEIISNCVVPVTLGSFTVQKQNKANKLSWTTTQELNSLKFVIEQSRNGRDFVTLGEVAAAGNSNTERTYSFTHNLPLTGYNYYRIKMVDVDNKVKYSQVRSVQNLGISQIQVTPNPVNDNMKVSINAERSDVATVMIADMSGKVILSKNFNVTAGDNDIPVSTAALHAGNYIVKVQLNGDVQVSKFIKL